MLIAAFATMTLPSQMQASEPLVPALKSNWLMMHVSVMMLSYSALMVGALLAIAFLIVTRGQNIQLQGSSVGTGGYRSNGYRLHKAAELISQPAAPSAENNGFARFESSSNGNGNANTAVLNLVTTSEPQTVASAEPLSPQRLSLAETLDNISYRIIGLGFPLLTIGIIAGGVWANEAWGSYWSWDPKETWALITWLVFAAYLHARITRGWQGRRPAILAATGFVVVWICYLGVNLLGKGLHSYGWFF
jgi:cytochrome c-type biogenesis protein CcsB